MFFCVWLISKQQYSSWWQTKNMEGGRRAWEGRRETHPRGLTTPTPHLLFVSIILPLLMFYPLHKSTFMWWLVTFGGSGFANFGLWHPQIGEIFTQLRILVWQKFHFGVSKSKKYCQRSQDIESISWVYLCSWMKTSSIDNSRNAANILTPGAATFVSYNFVHQVATLVKIENNEMAPLA